MRKRAVNCLLSRMFFLFVSGYTDGNYHSEFFAFGAISYVMKLNRIFERVRCH